jgi:hypothetical protein
VNGISTTRPCGQWTAQTSNPRLRRLSQELLKEQGQKKDASELIVFARTSFVHKYIGLALVGTYSSEYDVHVFQTVAFGLGKEPGEIN